MAPKQNVSVQVVIVVLVAVTAIAYVAFSRPELAPPGVGVCHHCGEEEPQLPWSPPVEPQELEAQRIGLMPLGMWAVFPPLGEDRRKGVRVAVVIRGSPAAQGGLRPGDLIKSFSNHRMSHPFGLAAALEVVKPEEKYELVVERSGEEHTLVITGLVPLPLEERAR